jgi:hypothetical protein
MVGFTKIAIIEAQADTSWKNGKSFFVNISHVDYYGTYNADKTACRIEYYTINNYDSNYVPLTELSIPNHLNGVPVVAIGGCLYDGEDDWRTFAGDTFFNDEVLGKYGKHITKVILPENLQTIEKYCFAGFSSLTEIEFPNSLKAVKENAFRGCSSLTEINLPASVTNILYNTFEDCTSLKKIAIDEANSTYFSTGELVLNKAKTKLVSSIQMLNSVIIPESVTIIGNNVFCKSSMKSVQFPVGLKKIEKGAFYSCANLKEITFPNGLETIEKETFLYCKRLSELKLNKGLKKIGTNAFFYCKFQNVLIPASVGSIGKGAFTNNHKNLKYKVDKSNKKFCAVKGFLCAKKTRELLNFQIRGKKATIPYGVRIVSSKSLANCQRPLTGLTGLTFPSTVKRIDKNWTNNFLWIKTVEFKGKKPPKISNKMRLKSPRAKKYTIKVPKKSWKAYQKALKRKLERGIEIVGV